MRQMAFRSRQKIRFADIDRAGIVYYPRFLHFFHTAMEDFFTDNLGIAYHHLIDKHRVGLPTVHVESDFMQPFEHGDILEVEIRVLHMGRTSLTFGYKGFKSNEEKPRTTGRNVVVCMNMDNFEKIKIPDWLRQKLETKTNGD